MTSLDEYDNIAAPFLMSRGLKFYSDQFNMHFPLPYYWAYLFSPLWLSASFSRAIAVFRLSLVFVYLISFILVFISYTNKKSKYSFSFWVVLLTLILPLYHGNLYLSDAFSTIFIVSLFWLYVPMVLHWEKFTNYHLFISTLLISLAFWTQPLLGILFITPLFFISYSQIKKYFSFSFFLNIIPIFLMFLNNQLFDFIDQTIIFNNQIYSRFFPEQIKNYPMMLQNLIVFFPHELTLFSFPKDPFSAFQFISHLSLVIFLIYLIYKKQSKYIYAILVIIISTRIREIKISPGQLFNCSFYPFIAIASSSLFLILFNTKNKIIRFFYCSLIVFSFIFSAKSLSPIIDQSLRPGYNYHVFWSNRQRLGEEIASLTTPDEKILIYPYDSDLYYFSNRLPFDKFIYWYPWINRNSNYRQQRLNALSDNPPKLIYYSNMSYRDNPTEYSSYFPQLLSEYRQIFFECEATNYWLLDNPSKPFHSGFSFACPLPISHN